MAKNSTLYMDRVDMGDGSYVIADVYEKTKQALIPRLRQLVMELTKNTPKRTAKNRDTSNIIFFPRSADGLVILPSGDWYSENDWTTGNIISLIQYFRGLNVDSVIEWAWESFICNTQEDKDEFFK